MLDLSALTAEIAATTSAEASAVTLIQNLVAEIAAHVDDPAALADLVANLKAGTDALAAAVVANTPTAPAAPIA